MHAGQRVEVVLVTTSEVAESSTEDQRVTLAARVREAVTVSALVTTGTVGFRWKCPLVFASEVPVSVWIKVFPSGTFDLSRDEKIDLLEAVVIVLREARGTVFPPLCEMKFRLVEIRGVLFAEAIGGPSFRVPERRFS